MILKDTVPKHGFAGSAPHSLVFWSIGADSRSLPKQAYGFKGDKPLVFYCGGIPVMSRLTEPEVAICREIRSYFTMPPEKYELVIVAEGSLTHSHKYDLPEHYNEAPETYRSSGAVEFVQRVLLPLIEDATSFDDVKRQFSRVNLMGHSYGVTFIQNVSNALRMTLEEHSTLSEAQIAEAMSAITVLNIGPGCKVVRKKGDFTQLFIAATDDEVSAEFVDYRTLVPDEHPVLGHALIGNSLFLLSKSLGSRTLAVRTTGGGVIDASEEQEKAHSLRLYMNINSEPVPGLRVFQVNASARMARDFLNGCLQDSLHACETHGARQPADIIRHLLEEDLSPFSKDEQGGLLRRNRQIVADMLTPAEKRGTIRE